jgi:hypothetical protein
MKGLSIILDIIIIIVMLISIYKFDKKTKQHNLLSKQYDTLLNLYNMEIGIRFEKINKYLSFVNKVDKVEGLINELTIKAIRNTSLYFNIYTILSVIRVLSSKQKKITVEQFNDINKTLINVESEYKLTLDGNNEYDISYVHSF